MGLDQTGVAVTADGTRLAFQTSGAPSSPALLLLAGQSNSHLWWEDLRADFAPEYFTITFDYRGTGDTVVSVEDPPWTTALFAEDARAVLRALGRTEADVYGTSMGGRVAQMLTLNHPSAVRRLVLAGSSPGGELAVGYDGEVRRLLSQRSASARQSALLELMYTPAWPGTSSRLVGDPTMTPTSLRRQVTMSAGHDALSRLGEISIPTLIMHGQADRMVPVINAQLLQKHIADARLITHPVGRHGFFDEFRRTVSAEVMTFLER